MHEGENGEGGDESIVMQHGEGVGADGEVERVERNDIEKGGGEGEG